MITLRAIDAMDGLVSDAIDEKRMGLDFSEEEYREQLRIIYEKGTKDIQDNLDRVLSSCTKEECDATHQRFMRNFIRVQERLKSLKEKVENITEGLNDGTGRDKAQIEFCRKVLSFIRAICTQINNISVEALTNTEIKDVYYHAVKKNKDELCTIYNNLVQKTWIEGEYTSLGDFIHYFSGEGLKPRHCIRWNKSLAMLAAFIDLMTDDNKPLSKAANIFTICTDKDTDYHHFTSDSLKQRRYSALNDADAPFFSYQETIKKEIFGGL